MRYGVLWPAMQDSAIGMKFPLSTFSFVLLVLVAVLLTAAGNVINDYFDQKVDRINKPQNVIIGTKVKRRVAIVLHQSMNVLALLFTLFICFRYQYYWPVLFPIVIATILWWYSPALKTKFLVGNIAVAFCTAVVPLWAVLFEMELIQRKYSDMLVEPSAFFNKLWFAITVIAFFAFLLSLIREVLKDMEDVSGDREGGYKTLPIKKGLAFAKTYSLLLYLLYLLAISGIGFLIFKKSDYAISKIIVFVIFTILPAIFAVFLLLNAKDKSGYHRASGATKIVMLFGLIYLIVTNFIK